MLVLRPVESGDLDSLLSALSPDEIAAAEQKCGSGSTRDELSTHMLRSEQVWCAADEHGAVCIFGVCEAQAMAPDYEGDDGMLWATKTNRLRSHLRQLQRKLPGCLKSMLLHHPALVIAMDAADACGAKWLQSVGFAAHGTPHFADSLAVQMYRLEGASQEHGEPARPPASLN